MGDTLSPSEPAAPAAPPTPPNADLTTIIQSSDASPVDKAKAAGYTDDEINSYLAPRVAAARAAGYSQDEINAHLGIKPPPPFDEKPLRAQITANLAASPKPVTSFTDALEAGWQLSTTGLVSRGTVPSKTLAEDAPWTSRMAANVATMAGDIPAMVGGFAIGGGLGAETGPGAAITGAAGAFALPTVLRQTLMDSYQKGEFTSFRDFWTRAAPIFMDTAKSYITGAATGGVGKAVSAVEGTIPGAIANWALPGSVRAAQTAAEIATMTTVGKGLEGEVPSARDFLDAAITLGGLKFAEFGAGKLRAIYARTGVPPGKVVQDAASDVTIQQDLMAGKDMPDAYMAHLEQEARLAGQDEASGGESGEGEPAGQQAQEVPRTPRATPFEPEKEPLRLNSFLKQPFTIGRPGDINTITMDGGLKDPGGDINAIIGGVRGRPGFINNSSGQNLDDAAQRAHEAGYFPGHAERPSINELLEAIGEDHFGNAQYSIHDQNAADAYRHAVAGNSEVQRISNETGIPTTNRTREQFWDAVAQHYSVEEMAQRHAEMDASQEADHAEFEKQAKAWVAYHGTPHTFDEFDTAHIGSGEGAQAFGHGLYFAENKGIADSYREMLSVNEPKFEGVPISEQQGRAFSDPDEHVAFSELLAYDTPSAAVRGLRSESDPHSDRLADVIEKWQRDGKLTEDEGTGHTLTVRIKARPEEMLDWDKPLSEQPAIVAKLDAAGIPHGADLRQTGESLHDALLHNDSGIDAKTGRPDQAELSAQLSAAGIKGIRYLDAGSRGRRVLVDRDGNPITPNTPAEALALTLVEMHAGDFDLARKMNQDNARHLGQDRSNIESAINDLEREGVKFGPEDTHNVVIFHHGDVEITHRNGEPVPPKDFTPEQFYGHDQTRSLEDLEREYGQENAATAAGQYAGGDAQPGSAAGAAQAGQGGVRQGGQPAGAPGGAGPPGTGGGGPTGTGTGGGGGGGPPGGGGGGVGAPPPTGTPQERILAHMSIGVAPSTRPWTWSRLYTDVVNKLFPIEQAVTRTAGANVLPVAEDAGKLARLLSGANGIADRFLNFNTLDFTTRQPNGPGLQDILAPVRDDLNGFRAYIASRHALDLESQGIKTGFDLADAQAVVAAGGHFQGPANELTAFSNRMAAYLRDSGVISVDAYNSMTASRAFYVPFQRVIDRVTGGGGGPGESLQPSDPVHAMVGSERMVIDPIESIVRNAYLFAQMAERNVTGTKLVDLLLAHGEAESTSAPPPPGVSVAVLRGLGIGVDPHDFEAIVQAARPTMGAEVRIFRNGAVETYRVDPELATAVQGLDSQNMGDLERMLRPLASTLRAGAVLQPDFMVRHTIRDFLYATVTHPGWFSPADLVRGFMSLGEKDQAYQEWLSSGGANVSMVSFDRRYLQNSIDDLTGTGLLERAWNVVQNPTTSTAQKAAAFGVTLPMNIARKFVLNPLQAGVQFAETATHIGTFIKAREEMMAAQGGAPLTKEQTLEAGYQSRDVAVDAARIGAKMRAWNAISAFSNIAIQDTDRVVRAFSNSPMSTALKVAGAISLPSALVWWSGHDDPRYRDAPDWERDLFWVVPTDRWQNAMPQEAVGRPTELVRTNDGQLQVNNGVTLRIPKPWGMGLIFGSGVERAFDGFYNHTPDAFKGFMASLGSVSIPSLIPNAITPIIEQFANRSIFTNRTLVPDQMEKYLPEYQYTPYTTETAKALGQLLSAFPGVHDASVEQGRLGGVARSFTSPILLENYLRAWTGNLGMYALQAADLGLRKAGVVPDPPNQPASTLADIPFVRAFVARYPTSSAQSIQDFHDAYSANKVYFDTWMGMAKEGNAEAMDRISRAGGPMMMVQLNSINTVINEQNQMIRMIYKNPDIPSDEKRQLIDTAYWRMSDIAKAGNSALAQARASLSQRAAAPVQ